MGIIELYDKHGKTMPNCDQHLIIATNFLVVVVCLSCFVIWQWENIRPMSIIRILSFILLFFGDVFGNVS